MESYDFLYFVLLYCFLLNIQLAFLKKSNSRRLLSIIGRGAIRAKLSEYIA